MTEEQRDVIAILEHDHREVEAMFAELESLRGASSQPQRARRKDLADQVVIELVRHSVAEEAEVYPVVKERISDTEAEHAKHEHAEAEQTMKRLDGLDPDDPEFDTVLAELMREIRAHVAEEEGQMFPQLRAAFTPEELVRMGRRVELVKNVAPTRPHPWAPDEPPGDKLLGPVAGLFDRLRDAASGRGTER